ncbi:hypothetical protein KFE96_11785 [Kordiimonas sp. SCSIO 12603]|uniref:hypothetical protein n=1 Tax=Kordiimonas sp. SCSIO 12603 TaxID=2829596 RepID=UPI0021053B05|nr:hypothetical protein [Kordiimonas sp. SCSIO 12603]UTW57520.1 hypothetical protein KFE96_11785 [Kordiimonas sp. SCSIO 12603]
MQLEYNADQKALQPELVAANINPESFLATDYLNHFNEIVMLLEMIPDMPDIVEEAAEWEPKSYPQHFEDSGFQAKQLAIKAFEIAPAPIRKAFDRNKTELDQLLSSTIAGLMSLNVIERGLAPAAAELIRTRIQQAQDLLLKLNQVIHGKLDEEIEYDDTMPIEEHDAEEVQSQADIDKLFD